MPRMTLPQNTIHKFNLNSLVRRTNQTHKLKALFKSVGATLCRKGRSRNWTLLINTDQIEAITSLIRESEENTWLWVVKIISDNKRAWSIIELFDYAKKNRSITVTSLMSESDCTLSEARKTIDALEWETN